MDGENIKNMERQRMKEEGSEKTIHQQEGRGILLYIGMTEKLNYVIDSD
jgi:hypothetical protein